MTDFSVFESTKKWAKENDFLLFEKAEIDSTNRWAKAEFESAKAQKAIYLADFQSAGRGRYDRTWVSPQKGTSLLSTWCFSIPRPMQAPFPIRLGLSLFESLDSTWPQANWALKAPNDIYLSDKKVAGLLIESTSSKSGHFLFVGLGLNVVSNPADVEISGNLTNELDKFSISTRWVEFLQSWSGQLAKLLVDRTTVQLASQLSPIEQSQLLLALNRLPHLKERYIRVSSEGDLYTQTQKISWQDL